MCVCVRQRDPKICQKKRSLIDGAQPNPISLCLFSVSWLYFFFRGQMFVCLSPPNAVCGYANLGWVKFRNEDFLIHVQYTVRNKCDLLNPRTLRAYYTDHTAPPAKQSDLHAASSSPPVGFSSFFIPPLLSLVDLAWQNSCETEHTTVIDIRNLFGLCFRLYLLSVKRFFI